MKSLSFRGNGVLAVAVCVAAAVSSAAAGSLEPQVKSLLLAAKNASSAPEARTVTKDCLATIDLAIAEDDYPTATKLVAVAVDSAGKSGNVHLQVVCKRRKEEVTLLAREFRKLAKAADKVSSGSADAQAARDMGQFYCLLVGDWPRGLPLLARSGGDWAKVAVNDAKNPADIDGQMTLGAAWMKISAEVKAPHKRGAQLRAGFWLRQALQQATGDSRKQIVAALDELPFRYLTDLDELDIKPGPWPLGRYGTNGVSAPIQVNGFRSPLGLGLHPPSSGAASVTFPLEGKYKTLATGVALNDSESGFGGTIVFSILGDGRLLWKSRPIKAHDVAEFCEVNVKGVRQLELRTECEGSSVNGHACWLDPLLGK